MKKRKGIFLIEMIVVLSIILAIINFSAPPTKSLLSIGNHNSDKLIVATIATAITKYRYDIGSYPSKLSDLTIKGGPSNSFGPWLTNSNLLDSKGKNINYMFDSTNNFFKVWANGSNSVNNTNSSDANIGGDDIGIVIRQ